MANVSASLLSRRVRSGPSRAESALACRSADIRDEVEDTGPTVRPTAPRSPLIPRRPLITLGSSRPGSMAYFAPTPARPLTIEGLALLRTKYEPDMEGPTVRLTSPLHD